MHTHPRTGQLVLHWLPTPRWEAIAAVPINKLSPSDAASAKRLLTATTMRPLQTADPLASLGVPPLARQHTPLSFWSGQGTRSALFINGTLLRTYTAYFSCQCMSCVCMYKAIQIHESICSEIVHQALSFLTSVCWCVQLQQAPGFPPPPVPAGQSQPGSLQASHRSALVP